MNFQMNPQSLGALNSVPIDMTLQALDWQQRAQQADQMSLAEMNAANQRAAQTHALAQETGRLGNETTLAQLPGVRATSAMQGRKNDMEAATFDQTMQQKLREFAIKATDDDLKVYEQQVQKLLNSPEGSEERKRGEKLWQASPIMMKAREDHKLKMELEKEQTYRTLEAQRIAAKSRETVATTPRPSAVKSAVAQGMDPKKLVGMLAQALLAETNPERKAELQQELEFATQLAERFQAIPPVGIDPSVAPGTLARPERGPVPQAPGLTPVPGSSANNPIILK